MEANGNLVWIILFMPLLGSIIQALFGGKVVAALGPAAGKKVMGAIATIAIAIPFAIGLMLTAAVAKADHHHNSVIVTLFDWIKIASITVPFEVVIDPLSMMMVLIITGIGSLIHLYATGYMAEERDYTRFFTYLNLFVSSMLILVLGNNLAMMFIGWEGVGLCSYLLIGFWYKDVANSKAANKAFIVNRIGDWGLTLGIFGLALLLMTNLPSLESGRFLSYDVIVNQGVLIFNKFPEMMTVIGVLLFIGACGKSAQFPLYFWLPDAMAGPTPVSALIHAATMVTAGVFMLTRLCSVYQSSPVASAIVCVVGAFTAVFAALIAFGQTDIKKVLAYSTVSQLGFMFIGCGAGLYWTGMFHVTTHAFFKALLFLGSGAVIHAMAHDQDMRNYGRLRKYLPITFITMFIGYLAISGVFIPGTKLGFAGFYSKESILGGALANQHAVVGNTNFAYITGYIGLFAAALTAMYMTRMTWMTFFGSEERWKSIPVAEHHDDHHHEGHHEHEAHHAHHAHESHADHGPDVHGFFYTDEQVEARLAAEPHEHHHGLDGSHKPHEVPPSMWIPLVVLAILSIGGGWWLENNHLLKHWLEPIETARLGEMSTHPEIDLMLYSGIAAFGGILLAVLYYVVLSRNKLPKSEGWDLSKWSPFRRAAMNQFGYDAAMVSAGVDGGGEIATTLWKRVDAGFIDGLVNGVGASAKAVGKLFGLLQTGYVRSYALLMLIGTGLILGLLVYRNLPVAPNTGVTSSETVISRGGSH